MFVDSYPQIVKNRCFGVTARVWPIQIISFWWPDNKTQQSACFFRRLSFIALLVFVCRIQVWNMCISTRVGMSPSQMIQYESRYMFHNLIQSLQITLLCYEVILMPHVDSEGSSLFHFSAQAHNLHPFHNIYIIYSCTI